MSKWFRAKYIIGAAITAVWVITMVTLVRDYIIWYRPDVLPASQVTAAALAGGFKNVTEYHLVMSDKKPIGAARFAVTRLQGDDQNTTGFLAEFQMEARVRALGMNHKMAVTGGGVLDSEFVLDRFALDAKAGPATFSADGRLVGTMLLLDMGRFGTHQKSRIRMPNDVSLLQAIQPTVTNRMEIARGNAVRIPVFDPIFSMQHGSMDITIEEKEEITVANKQVEAWRVTSQLGETRTQMWIDNQGEVLKRNLIMENMSLDRCTREEALAVVPTLETAVSIQLLDIQDFHDVPLTTAEELARSSGVAYLLGISAQR